jgi:hypothetical protein
MEHLVTPYGSCTRADDVHDVELRANASRILQHVNFMLLSNWCAFRDGNNFCYAF